MQKLKTWVVGMILTASLVTSTAVRAATIRDGTGPEAIMNKPSSDERSEVLINDYVIGSEDVLEIVVWKNAELSRAVTVRPDGKISLPLVGDVRAAGLTASGLRESIRTRLEEFQKVPQVSVIVQEVNSYNIFILGEIPNPGKYQLKSDVTLLQALSMAGGFTQLASRNNIMILRRQHGKRQEEIIKFGYMDFIINEDTRKNVLLKRGDTIIVP